MYIKLFEEFINNINIFLKIKNNIKLNKTEYNLLLDIINKFNYSNYNPYKKDKLLLYHGSPDKIIKFEITKGTRGGTDNKIIDNLGVFLTDNYKTAEFFGNNRSKDGNYIVYPVFADLKNILDMSKITNIPINARKIALSFIEKYDGTKLSINNIPIKYHWLLLDNIDFINEIKKNLFDSIKFKESIKTIKNSYSYIVFDMNKIEIAKKYIKTYQDIINNLDLLQNFYENSYNK